MDSDLEQFSHKRMDGSLAALWEQIAVKNQLFE